MPDTFVCNLLRCILFGAMLGLIFGILMILIATPFELFGRIIYFFQKDKIARREKLKQVLHTKILPALQEFQEAYNKYNLQGLDSTLQLFYACLESHGLIMQDGKLMDKYTKEVYSETSEEEAQKAWQEFLKEMGIQEIKQEAK